MENQLNIDEKLELIKERVDKYIKDPRIEDKDKPLLQDMKLLKDKIERAKNNDEKLDIIEGEIKYYEEKIKKDKKDITWLKKNRLESKCEDFLYQTEDKEKAYKAFMEFKEDTGAEDIVEKFMNQHQYILDKLKK